ncbi:MAG: hypothetical protein KZQ95_11735 [Candidatus Thiodiazotropha sp. (ex Epidulcina cf. delphinae)]|nr:hypothetical protein [Candidatus Thiodiazotropha sp. (ex Epidulcina cf. delphinae)]
MFISERLKTNRERGRAHILYWIILFVGILVSSQTIADETVDTKRTEVISADTSDEIIPFRQDDYLQEFSIGRAVGALFLAILAAYFIVYILKSHLHGLRASSTVNNIVIKDSRRISQKLTVAIVEINKNEYHVFHTGSDLNVFRSQYHEKNILDKQDDAT